MGPKDYEQLQEIKPQLKNRLHAIYRGVEANVEAIKYSSDSLF